jgi:hypothetical protein
MLSRVLVKEIGAIQLARKPDAPSICRIPSGSHISVTGRSSMTGMLEIDWRNVPYAIYEADLYARTIERRETESGSSE